tara:strand:+ start:572 stop:1534 length:963 start_codon:yes stop_codon:yes gene_type:complete
MNRRIKNKWNNNSPDKEEGGYEYKKNRYKSEQKNYKKTKNNEPYKKEDKFKRKDKRNLKDQFIKERYQEKENNLDDLIWGKHSVLSVLESKKPINRIWCTSEIRSSEKFFLLLKEIKSKGVLVEEVPWSRINQITAGGVHQGIVLQKSYSQAIPLNELIDYAKLNSSHPTIVCLDGITDPHNVGAIIRSAEALGCKGIIIPQRRCAGITGTVAKVAAGALENIKISRVVNLNRSLSDLKNEGFIIVGLSSDSNVNISAFQEKVPLVIVIGSENKGLSLLTQKNCDYLLKIPLIGKTPSLNASVAAGISIFQLSKNFSVIK